MIQSWHAVCSWELAPLAPGCAACGSVFMAVSFQPLCFCGVRCDASSFTYAFVDLSPVLFLVSPAQVLSVLLSKKLVPSFVGFFPVVFLSALISDPPAQSLRTQGRTWSLRGRPERKVETASSTGCLGLTALTYLLPNCS